MTRDFLADAEPEEYCALQRKLVDMEMRVNLLASHSDQRQHVVHSAGAETNISKVLRRPIVWPNTCASWQREFVHGDCTWLDE